MEFTPVIGLEIHVELKTKSKMFSNAPVVYGKEPNTQCVPLDFAFPGTMPTVNKEGVIYAIRVSNALHMSIDHELHFDRKNYFYSDLPKGYQISQNRRPIGSEGYVEIEVNGICFQIIGIFTGLRGDVDTNFILFPSTTIMSLWKMEDKYSTIELNMDLKHLQTEEEEKDFITNVRKLIGKEHRFDYRDEGAVAFNSLFGAFRQVNSMLGGMRMTILLFCIFILISEIFGVSNILFISVRERTYEIVLRRLMGASDANIFSLVLCESVVVMLLSSIVGIFLAEGALRLLDSAVTFMWNGDRGIWGSFVVDIPILTGVMLATIVSGIIAGVAPAKRAVKLKITEVHG